MPKNTKNKKFISKGEKETSDDSDFDELDDFDEMDLDQDFFTREFSKPQFSRTMNREDASVMDKHREKKKFKSEDSSTTDSVFDLSTSKIIYRFISKRYIKGLDGVISTGKEANVYFAEALDLSLTDNQHFLAVKVYRTRTLDFKKIKAYIAGDRRFSKRTGRKSHQIIQQWALKEFKNLQRALEAGLSVPKPLEVRRNVLLMEFIGRDKLAAPTLHNIRKESKFLEVAADIYTQLLENMKVLWKKADLVHGDLSEYNILGLFPEDPNGKLKYYIIDISQAVLTSHPAANQLLLRDINNINIFFDTLNVEVPVLPLEVIYKNITNYEPKMTDLLRFENF